MTAQLEFGLDDVRSVLPWGGQSPRVLTAAYARFTLKAQAAKDERFFVDPDQGDFFDEVPNGPPAYGGASLLLPLDAGKRRTLSQEG